MFTVVVGGCGVMVSGVVLWVCLSVVCGVSCCLVDGFVLFLGCFGVVVSVVVVLLRWLVTFCHGLVFDSGVLYGVGSVFGVPLVGPAARVSPSSGHSRAPLSEAAACVA